VGARRDDAFGFGEARQEDVEKAAEGEAEQRGEDGSEKMRIGDDFVYAPWLCLAAGRFEKADPQGLKPPEIVGLRCTG
jgi:hypothetical protein